MRTQSWLLLLVVPVLFLFSGCGQKGSAELSPAETQSFETGPPGAKQMWALALEASKTNDYVTAYNMLYTLGGQTLSPEQKAAVTKQTASLNDRLLDAVGKGDPAAQKALDELKHNPPNRQAH